MVAGTIAIVLVTIAIGIFVDRKVGLLPRADKLAEPRPRMPSHVAGEAPATAIRAGTAQLSKLRAQRCRSCRAAMTAGDDDHVRYDERDLIVLHYRCPRCGAKRSLYVEHVA
jgi:RNase P subunit RPR2